MPLVGQDLKTHAGPLFGRSAGTLMGKGRESV